MSLLSVHPITMEQIKNVPNKKGEMVETPFHTPIGRVYVEDKPNSMRKDYSVCVFNDPQIVVHSRADVTKIANFYLGKVQWKHTKVDKTGQYLVKKRIPTGPSGTPTSGLD